MNAKKSVTIDSDRCSGCGLCVDACPFKSIEMRDGKPVHSGENCISCGHCAASCPNDAVRVSLIDPSASEFATFTADNRWLPHGQFDTQALVRLMGSRRSCRDFLDRAVDRAILDDLVRIGITAPSGTNCQLWTFTILPTRRSVLSFSNHIATFFKNLNAMAEKRMLRTVLKVFGKGELDEYYKRYYSIVKKGLDEYEETGRDRLFHGAPAAIIVGSKPGASCPAEDALLASQNILLAAHSMGLGSCLIGFAVSAIKEAPEIKKSIGIPMDETVYAVIALGYPNETYQTTAGRKKPELRYFEG